MTRLDDLRAIRAFIDREIAAELGPQAATAAPLQRVADLYGVTVEDMLGGSRAHRAARARQAAAWLLRREEHSYRSIARLLGYSDHTTVRRNFNIVEADAARRALLLGLVA